MDSRNPDELITEVKEEQQTRGELATEALQWFLDGNVGELFPREDVVDELSDELDITNRQANTAISDTVGDIVDPVQQIVKSNKKYVGVIDYKIFNDEGAYGYVDFDDRKGKRKRVVCARCVEKHTYDENIKHATQGEGSSNSDATWQQLLNKVTSHYATQHTTSPSHIEPGASLVSGTTISGNTAFHAGNESNIDHNNLSNRTHSGDDLTPSSVSSNTLEAGGAPIETDWFSKIESGPVAVGNAAILVQREVPDGETLYVTQAGHTVADGSPAPSGYDLKIATLDGAGGGAERQDILTGDGTTIYDDETGSPLASWTNNTGSPQQTAILMNNGEFGDGASDKVDGYAEVTGRVA